MGDHKKEEIPNSRNLPLEDEEFRKVYQYVATHEKALPRGVPFSRVCEGTGIKKGILYYRLFGTKEQRKEGKPGKWQKYFQIIRRPLDDSPNARAFIYLKTAKVGVVSEPY